jgi:hypothetical protein
MSRSNACSRAAESKYSHLSQHVSDEPPPASSVAASAVPSGRKKLINTKKQPNKMSPNTTNINSENDAVVVLPATRTSTHRKKTTVTNSSNSNVKYIAGYANSSYNTYNYNNSSTEDAGGAVAGYKALPIVNKFNSVPLEGHNLPAAKSTVLLTQRQSMVVPTIHNSATGTSSNGGGGGGRSYKAAVFTQQRQSPPEKPSFLMAINRPQSSERIANAELPPSSYHQQQRNFRLIESIVINKGSQLKLFYHFEYLDMVNLASNELIKNFKTVRLDI